MKELLEGLRWNVNRCVTNPFGERVWFKACYKEDGTRNGITDCCYEDDPCEIHKKISEEQESN